MSNALTVDLEFWWCNEFLKGHLPDEKEDYIQQSTKNLLNLFEKYDTTATFFVLGKVAEKYPSLIEKIYDKGHEIGVHGYSHTPLHELGREKFEKEFNKTVKLLEEYNPTGYRAPSFSVDNDTKWIFEVLEEYGFKYDSSIFPIKSKYYGVPDAPVNIYKPSKKDVSKHSEDGKIIEFPMTVTRFLGKNFPISGGFYLRTIPLPILKWRLKKESKDRPIILYIHPRDVNPNIPRLDVPCFSRFVTYYGINNSIKKLQKILNEFSFKNTNMILEKNLK